ncbi:MAG TPA: DNA-processing protein DprA, partial [Rubricoccaceae bacterium]|nr:DNA-processing protein DprA [Rubricoccaceae bacterium]
QLPSPVRPPLLVDTAASSFVLALLGLDGVGRVTAHRLLERFPTLDALRACPREQVLLRLKGLPHAERTVTLLFDEAAFAPHLDRARAAVEEMAARRIAVVVPGHAHWPAALDALAPADRPAALYAFGDTAVLAARPVALFGRAPLPADAYEAAQGLAERLLAERLPLACGAAPGFDVALHKRYAAAGLPCVMVARAGLARVDPPARPGVAAAVKAGGVLVSPFPPTHGPFDHDDRERALVQAALAGPAAFFAPAAGSPEAKALAWALEAGRPVFGVEGDPAADAGLLHLSTRVHRLARPVDLDWVVAAARAERG